MADLEIQMLEQQRLIEQLKSMIRDGEVAAQKKDKELQDLNAKLSKMKLQAKAKLAREAKDAKEAKGAKSAQKKDSSAAEKESEPGGDVEENQDRNTRAKSLLLKKKLEDKDRVIKEIEESVSLKDQQIEVKEKIIAEREEIISSLTKQLEEKTKLMEEMSVNNTADGSGDNEARVQQMYAQIVYKDKNLLELNNKILELERRLIDLQEFIGEKNEVIRGRDKVIEVLQSAMKEKDQNVTDQALLISKLTSKVETNDETLGHLREQVQKAEHDLKHERERFNLRLTESQRYFEDTLKEQEESISRLRKVIQDKEAELLVSENDLRELITRHERDIQKIMSKGEVNLQDSVIQMLEQKLKDTNEVLEGKIKVIEVLQKDSSQKEKELEESREVQKIFKNKLQEMSEQMLLFQANQVDMEVQWQEERKKYETKLSDITEKHEHELTEKELQIQSLKSSASQLETAYTQSVTQYSVLQERYQQHVTKGDTVPSGHVDSTAGSGDTAEVESEISQMKAALREKDKQVEEFECLNMKVESLTAILKEKEEENVKLREEMLSKAEDVAKTKKSTDKEAGSSKGDTKMLKMKAQLTAKVKSLENELSELKKSKSPDIKAEPQENISSLKDELNSANESLSNMQKQIQTLETEIESLKQVQDEQSQAINQLKSDLEFKSNELVKSEIGVENIKSELDAAHTDLENKSEELATLRTELEKEAEENALVKSDLENRIKEISTLRSDLENKSLGIETVNNDMDNKNAELEFVKGSLHSKDEELEKTQSVLKEKSVELETVYKDLQGKTKEIEVLKGDIEDRTSKLNSLVEEFKRKTAELDLMKKDLENKTSELECVLKESENRNEENSSLLHTIKMKAADLSLLTEQIEGLKVNLNESISVNEDLRLQLTEKDKAVDTFLNSVNLKDCDLSGAVQVFENNSLQVKTLLKEKEELDAKLENTKSENAVMNETIQKLKSNESDLLSQQNETQKEIDTLCSYKTDLENKLKDSELSVKQQQREIDMLKESQTAKGDETEEKMKSLLDQLTVLEKENADINSKYEKVQSELSKILEDNMEVKSSVVLLQEELQKTRSETSQDLLKKDEIIQSLQDKCTENEGKFKDMVTESKAKEEVLIEEQEKINKLLNDVQEENKIIHEDKVQMCSELESQINVTKELEDKCTSYCEEIKKLSSHLEISEIKRQEVENEVKELKCSEESKLLDALTQLKASEESVVHLKNTLEEVQGSFSVEVEKLKERERETVQSLQNEMDTMKSKLGDEIQVLTETVGKLREDKDNLLSKDAYDEVALELETKKEKLSALQEQLTEAENRFRVSEEQCTLLLSQKSDIEKENLDLIEKLGQLRVTVDNLNQNKEALEKMLHNAETHLDSMSAPKAATTSNSSTTENGSKTVNTTAIAHVTVREEQILRSGESEHVEAKDDIFSNRLEGQLLESSFEEGVSDFHDFCEKLESEKKQLQEQLTNKEKILKKKEGRIKSLMKQLDSLKSKKDIQTETEETEVKEEIVVQVSEPLQSSEIIAAKKNITQEAHFAEEASNDMFMEELLPHETSSLNSSFSSMTSDKEQDMYTADDLTVKVLTERLKAVTDERNKFKTDNKKLLKLGKGKDTKLKIMNQNFEKLRLERDELLSERDSLENKVQDLSESFVDKFKNECSVELENRCAELESLLIEKDKEIANMSMMLSRYTEPESTESSFEVNTLSRENEKLKLEAAKLQRIGKGKTAQIMKMSQDYEHNLSSKEMEIQEKEVHIHEIEAMLTEAKRDLEKMQVEKEKLSTSNTKLQKVNKGKDAKVKRFEAELIEKDKLLHEKEDDIVSLQDRLSDLNNQITVLNEKEDELRTQIECSAQCTQKWQAQCESLELKVKELSDTIATKQLEIDNLIDNEKMMKKIKEEKIILEFELDCAKEELEKVKSDIDTEDDKRKEMTSNVDDLIKRKDSFISEASIIQENISSFETENDNTTHDHAEETEAVSSSTDEIKAKAAALLSENKKLLQEKNKLQKLGKGKDAKLKKVEDFIREQQKIISDKETDILILQENLKESNSKVEMLEEIEQDLQYRLNIALTDVDEWRDHCHELEDRLDAAHEAIDMKNEELERFEDDFANIKDDYNALITERDELERERDDLIQNLNDLKTKIQAKEEEVSDLNNQLQQITAEKETITTDMKKLQMLAKGKDAKVRKIEESVTMYENTVKEKDLEIAILKQHHERLENELNALTTERQETDYQIKTYSFERDHFSEQNQSLSAQVNALTQENLLKQEEVSQLQIAVEELQNGTVKQNSEIEKMKEFFEQTVLEKDSMIQMQASQINNITDDKTELENRNHSLASALSDLENNQAHITEVGQYWENKANEIEGMIGEKDTKLNESIDKLRAVETVCAELQTELNSKTKEIEKHLSENDVLRRSLFELDENLQQQRVQDENKEEILKEAESKVIIHAQQYQEKMEEVDILKNKCTALEKQFDASLLQINEKENEISNLRKKCMQTEQELHSANIKLSEKEAYVTATTEKIHATESSSEEKISQLTSKLAELQNDVQEKELKEKSNASELEQFRSDINNLQMQIIKDKNDIEEMEVGKQQQEQQLIWFNQYYSETSQRLSDMEEYCNKLQNENHIKDEQIKVFEAKVTELEASCRDSREENTTIQNENKHFSEIMEQIRTEKSSLENKVATLTKEIQTLKEALQAADNSQLTARLQEEIINLEQKNALLNNHIQEQKVFLDQYSLEIDTLKRSNDQNNEQLVCVKESFTKESVQQQGASRQDFETVLDKPETSSQSFVEGEKQIHLEEEIQKLKKLCKGKDARIKKLENKVKKAQQSSENGVVNVPVTDSSSAADHRQDDQVLELQRALEASKHECEKHKQDVDLLNQKCLSLETDLQRTSTYVQEIENQNSFNQNELLRFKEEIEGFENEIKNSRFVNDELNETVARYQKNFDVLQTQAWETEECLTTSNSVLNQEILQMREQFKELNAKYEVLHHQNTEKELLVKLKEDELLQLKSVMKQNIVELDDMRKTNEFLQQSGQGMESEKQKIEDLLKSEREEIQSLYEQMNQLVSEKLDLECNLEQKERDLRTAAEELRQFASDRDNLDDILERKSELEAEVENLNRDLAELRKRLKDRDNRVTELEQKEEKSKLEIEKLNTDVHLISETKHMLENEIKSLSEQMTMTDDNNSALNSELHAKREACSKLNSVIQENNQLLESLRSTVDESMNEVEKYKRQCKNFQEEITLYKEQLEVHNSMIRSVQDLENKCQELHSENKRLECVILNEKQSFADQIITKDTEISSLKAVISQLESMAVVKEVIQKDSSAMVEMNQDLFTPEIVEEKIQAAEVTPEEQTVIKPEVRLGVTASKPIEGNLFSQIDSVARDELQSSFDEKVNQIQALEAEVEKLKQEENQKDLNHCADLEKKLSQKDEKIAFLLENMQEMEERLSQLAANEDTVEDGQSVNDKMKQFEEKIVSLQTQVQEKEVKFTKALATAKKIKIQLNQANAVIEKEKATKEALEKRLEAVNAGVENTESEMKDPNNQKVHGLQAEIDSHREFSQQLQDQVQSLTDKLHESDRSVNQLRDELSKMQESKNALENSVEEKEVQFTELSNKNIELNKIVKEQGYILEEKEKMNMLLQGEVQALSSIEQEQDVMHSIQAELQAITKQRDKLLKEKEEWENSLIEKQQQVETYELHANECMENLKHLQVEINTYVEQVKDLKSNLISTEKQKDEIEIQVNEKSMSIEQLASDLNKLTNENVELKSKIEELSARLQMLDSNNQALREEIVFKEEDIKNKSDELNQMRKSTNASEEMHKLLEDKESEISRLNKNMQTLSALIPEKERQIEKLQSCVSEQEQELKSQEEKLNEKETKHAQLQSSLDAAMHRFEENNLAIMRLQQDYDKIQEEVVDSRAVLLERDKLISDLQEEKRELQSDVDKNLSLMDEKEQLEVNLESLTAIVSEMKQKNEISKEEINSLQASLETFSDENSKLKDSVAESNERERSLKKEFDIQSSEILDAKSKFNDVQLNIAQVEEELREARNNLESSNIKLSEQDTEIASLRNEIKTLKSAKASLDAEMEALKSENETKSNGTDQQSQQLLEEIKLEKMKVADLSGKIESLSSFQILYEQLKEEKEVLDDRYCCIESENQSMKSQVTELIDKMNQFKVQIEELTVEKLTYSNSIEELSERLSNLKSQYDELEQCSNNLGQENNDLKSSLSTLQDKMLSAMQSVEEVNESNKNLTKQYEELLTETEKLKDENTLLKDAQVKHQSTQEKESNTSSKEMYQETAPFGPSELVDSRLNDSWTDVVYEETITPLQASEECLMLQQDNSLHQESSEQIAALQAELDSLKTHSEKLIQEHELLKETNESKSLKLEKMLTKLKTFKERNEKYQTEIAELQQQIVTLKKLEENKQAQLQHQCETLEAQVSKLGERLDESTALSLKAESTNKTLTADNKQMGDLIESLESELKVLNETKNHLQEELQKMSERSTCDLSAIKSEYVDVQNKNIELLEEIDSLKSSLENARQALQATESEKEGLEDQMANLVSEMFGNKMKSSEYETEMKYLKEKCAEADLQIDELKVKKELAQRQLIDMKEQYEMLEKDNENYQILLEKQTIANTELKNEIARQKIKLERIESENKQSEVQTKEIEKLQTELTEAETERKYAEEEMDGLREDLIQAKKEKQDALLECKSALENLSAKQRECEAQKQENESLKWKLDEMVSLEEELESLQQEKLKTHQNHKDLVQEVQKLQSTIEEINADLSSKNKTVTELEGKIQELTDSGLKMSTSIKQEKDDAISILNQELEQQQGASLGKIMNLEEKLKDANEKLNQALIEKASIQKLMDKKEKQLQKFDILKEEYTSLNDEYNKILNDNSNLAKQVEELHSKLLDASRGSAKVPDETTKIHYEKERSNFENRVEELEGQCTELRHKNAELIEKCSKLDSQIQEMRFEKDTLTAQIQTVGDGDKSALFKKDYETLKHQFGEAMKQKNKLQTDLNLAQRSLGQREARCQQLAMQVSQLAEDRSYLNVQLASLSKSLREKEQELPHVQQQYRSLYQSYTALQAKASELEKRAVMDYMQQSPAPSSGSVTPKEGVSMSRTYELKKKLEATVSEQRRLQETNAELQRNVLMEQRKARELEQVLEISMHDRLGEAEMLDLDENGEDAGRIRHLQLTRDGTSSYLGRLQRWMTVPTAVPPVDQLEKPVQ